MSTSLDQEQEKKNSHRQSEEDMSHEAQESASSISTKSFSRRAGDVRAGSGGGAATWLISFTDVMALMLTFFVMLFAMSEPEKEQWSDVMTTLRSEMNSFYGPALSQGPQDTINLKKINLDRALDIGYLTLLIKSIVNESEYLDGAVIERQNDRLVISLPQDLLFSTGKAEPVEDGLRALYALGGALSRIKNKIEVVGHTDPQPISRNNKTFDNNWELSLARGLNVAAVLENVGYEKHIIVRGLSDGRYQDIGDKIAEEDRLAIARRVDIVIMNHDGRKTDIFADLDFE